MTLAHAAVAAVPAPPAGTGADSGSRLEVVLRSAPIDRAFRTTLETAGVEVLQYLPEGGYLVWRDAGAEVSPARTADAVWRPLTADRKRRHGATRGGRISLLVVARPSADEAVARIRETGALVEAVHPAQPDGRMIEVVTEVDDETAAALAALPTVAWLEPAPGRPLLAGEAVAADAVNHVGTAGEPLLGYWDQLARLGVDGSGVAWAVVDTGVDLQHPDLVGAVGVNAAGCETDPPGGDRDVRGHGTAVAGLLAGTAATGMVDYRGFLYGMGVAPSASMIAHNGVCLADGTWPPPGGWQTFSRDVVRAGAVGSNNSWQTVEGTGHGYTLTERTHDFMVRDADFETATVAEPLILVFIAGNKGPEPGSLDPPAEAKNLIVVGATTSWEGSAVDEQVVDYSSRGPTADGRVAPTLVAPGDWVTAPHHHDCRDVLGGFEIPDTDGRYAWFLGTSAATPVVSGALALVVERWRRDHRGADPSPAMARALLVHTAVDIGGMPAPPNADEGWGRLRIDLLLSTGAERVAFDQEVLLTDTGATWSATYDVADPTQPVVVTLVWSDTPAMPGASPALVNDLDLELRAGGELFLGNGTTANGRHLPDAARDRLNTVEKVVAVTSDRRVEITVRAAHLPGDGVPLNRFLVDQDFALVCDNCREPLPAPRRASRRVVPGGGGSVVRP